MRYQDIVFLIHSERIKTPNGYYQEVDTETEVFADVMSVTRSEFFAAKQHGIDMAITFEVSAHDYNGAKKLKYDGKLYKVERTYTKDGEKLQLNCSEIV